MGSEAAAALAAALTPAASMDIAEGARLLAAAAALFLGLALAVVVSMSLRRGDGHAARRWTGLSLSLAAAVGCGAAAFIIVARQAGVDALGGVFAAVLWYLASGFAAGFVGGLFPRAVGAPLVAAAAVAWALVAAEADSWRPVRPGEPVAALTVYSTSSRDSLVGFSVPEPDGIPVEQNLTLPPGPVSLEVDVLTIRGPFSFLVGPRYYRLAALAGGDGRVELPAGRYAIGSNRAADAVAAALGLSAARSRYAPFPPEELAAADFLIGPDGELTARRR